MLCDKPTALRMHSFQSLGTLDGPGVRAVVFAQGCPLRCVCCHNPDTWSFDVGEEIEISALAAKIMRCRAYFGESGGVTVSGGEPLMQATAVAELFGIMRANGIHTALDTSGCVFNEDVRKLLDVTDLVILDYKYTDETDYAKYTKCEKPAVDRFLDELTARNIPAWLRQVIIPGLNDTAESVLRLGKVAAAHGNVQKCELLPFRKLCAEKYKAMGIEFPLADTDEASEKAVAELQKLLG